MNIKSKEALKQLDDMRALVTYHKYYGKVYLSQQYGGRTVFTQGDISAAACDENGEEVNLSPDFIEHAGWKKPESAPVNVQVTLAEGSQPFSGDEICAVVLDDDGNPEFTLRIENEDGGNVFDPGIAGIYCDGVEGLPKDEETYYDGGDLGGDVTLISCFYNEMPMKEIIERALDISGFEGPVTVRAFQSYNDMAKYYKLEDAE